MPEKRVMKGYKLPPGLCERLAVRARAEGLSNTAFVQRALEEALSTEAGAGEDGRVSPARLAASPRALRREPLGLTPAERSQLGAARAEAFRAAARRG